jgi:hypothetical protein
MMEDDIRTLKDYLITLEFSFEKPFSSGVNNIFTPATKHFLTTGGLGVRP